MSTTDDVTIVQIDCALVVPGQNDRTVFDEAGLQELAASIAGDGLIQPITVRPIHLCPTCDHRQHLATDEGVGVTYGTCPECGNPTVARYEIVAGERRFRAVCQVLRRETIAGMIRPMDDEQADAVMLIENLGRKDLDPIDECEAYAKRMERHGWDAAQVAHHAKVSLRRVEDRLKLRHLVPEMKELVRKGQVSLNFAMAMWDLTPTYQYQAMKYFARTERPLLREFEAVVGALRVAQAQVSMFELAAWDMMGVVGDHNEQETARKTRRFPTDKHLPLMRKVHTIGLSMETYIHELMTSDDASHRAAAPIVGRVYEAMLAAGMCFAPRDKSPLDSL
jgi:hypothetical protein